MPSKTKALERAGALRTSPNQENRERIRRIIAGGPDALRAIWGEDSEIGMMRDIPAPNLIISSLKRFAQRAATVPKPKAVPLKDTQKSRDAAEKKARIIAGYDFAAQMEAFAKIWFRWYPVYGITGATVRHREHGGRPYPQLEVFNPYDTYASWTQPHEDPTEMAVFRRIATRDLHERFPQTVPRSQGRQGAVLLGQGADRGVSEILEYHDRSGWVLIHPDSEQLLASWENPFDVPAFIVSKAPSVEDVQSEYHHAIGLLGQLAKFYVLGAQVMQDAAHAETNVFGEMVRGKYAFGRRVVNYMEQGTKVEKPNTNLPYQFLQETDRIERQFRNIVGYSVQEDGISPNSFVTGRGLDSLGAAAGNTALEAQQVFGEFLQSADRLRLKWDQHFYPNITKQIPGQTETYRASEIDDVDNSRREFALLSLYDEPQKIIMGLQLLQAEALDVETFQENLANLPDSSLINNRRTRIRAEDGMMATVEAAAQALDPRAMEVLSQLMTEPQNRTNILQEFVAQLAETVNTQMGAPVGENPIANDDFGTVLSRLTPTGVESGSQVVAPF